MCGWDQSYTATSHSSAMLTSEGAHTMEQDDTHHGAKMASTATSTGSDGAETMTDTDVDMEMDMEEADMTQWTETEFEEKCTYIVKDTAWEAGPDGDAAMTTTTTTTRAEASLPRNLAFKHLAGSKEVVGVCSREYIPKGTRFGPLVGEIYTADSVPKDANRKYFWRVSTHIQNTHTCTTKHTHTSSEAGGTPSSDVTPV
ncbi:PR domain zinc finger protein 1-like [Stegastes partitus]|uniref:PR domain zinc finger protein 1-like n=1 Tax=Stegastes partitus TaxID=144197 RepID=A0A9Y4MYM2_9TELE|nr:PREDICTED: PR domain zinc finger protein 1-like [Stegastes partitus]